MKICYQKKKQIIYSEACPEAKLRAVAASAETKLLTDCCRLAIQYAEQEPEQMPDWFTKRYMKFLKEMTKEKGQAFLNKTNKQKLLLFSEYEKGEHPFINFCASGYDDSEVKDKNGNKKMGPWRKQKYVHLSGLVAIDIDHVDDARAIFERWQKEVDFKAMKIYLIYITPRGGLRVVFRCEASRGDLMSNQKWMCDRLKVNPDASCKDASRGYFLTYIDNFLYDDLKQMYEDEADEVFIRTYEPEYRAGGSRGTKDKPKAPKAAGQGTGNVGQMDAGAVSLKWKGYDIQAIIDARYGDKLPCSEDSNRHTESLKLATDLLILLDGDKARVQRIVEAQPWVQEIIAERDENVSQTVDSAADCVVQKEKKTPRPYPSKAMQEAVKAVTGKEYKVFVSSISGDSFQEEGSRDDMNQQLQEWGEEIEALFPYYPMLKDVCCGLKKSQYPAALFVSGGVLMTLMTRCWYRFYHRPEDERRLNCSLYIIGHPASDKSMAYAIYKILSSPIASADKAGLAALNRYKQELKKKAANKEGKDKPQGIIRIHPARTSNGQLIQDMLNAKEIVDGKEVQLHMFTFDTELDNSITLQSGGSWINKQAMELKAFHNEEDGQMYQNSDSPVDEFAVTWNFIYTGTPLALKKKVNERNIGSGLSTRLAVIPMPKTNCEMMALEDVKKIDWQRLDRMKTWAYKLDRRAGELSLWPMVLKLYDWTKERMEECLVDFEGDRRDAVEMMLKRVPYHAINYSAPFIDMRHWDSIHQDGNYWKGDYEVDETDWKLCELIARIQYATQQRYFGVMAEKYFCDMNNDVQISDKRRYQKTIVSFNSLPEVFTKEDVTRTFGYTNKNGVSVKINRLISQKLIKEIEEGEDKGKYRKLVQVIR